MSKHRTPLCRKVSPCIFEGSLELVALTQTCLTLVSWTCLCSFSSLTRLHAAYFLEFISRDVPSVGPCCQYVHFIHATSVRDASTILEKPCMFAVQQTACQKLSITQIEHATLLPRRGTASPQNTPTSNLDFLSTAILSGETSASGTTGIYDN